MLDVFLHAVRIALLDEILDRLDLPFLTGSMQSGTATVVRLVGIGSSLNKELEYFHVPFPGCQLDRSNTRVVSSTNIGVRKASKKLHCLVVTILRGKVERDATVVILLTHTAAW